MYSGAFTLSKQIILKQEILIRALFLPQWGDWFCDITLKKYLPAIKCEGLVVALFHRLMGAFSHPTEEVGLVSPRNSTTTMKLWVVSLCMHNFKSMD